MIEHIKLTLQYEMTKMKKLLILSVLFVAVLSKYVVPQHPTGRIVGGNEAVPHSIPSQAFLSLSGDFHSLCGGSLISQNYVLTAAHCCFGLKQANITLGAHNIARWEDTQLTLTSSEYKTHDNYVWGDIQYDICVIKLPSPVEYTDAIQTIPLPKRSDVTNSYLLKTGRISGWGYRLLAGNMQLPPKLQTAQVSVISNRVCSMTFGPVISPAHICTLGADDISTANGDSGGPLIVDGVQVGIVSFGATESPAGLPNAYTRLTEYLDWIENYTDVVIKA